MAMNKDNTELDAPPNAAVNDVVVERAEDDVCVDSKVETTNAPPQEPEETIAASPLDATATAVEACNNINASDITSPAPTNEAAGVDTTTTSQQREDLSILTVVQLEDRLRGLNLAVSGRKQELIDRLMKEWINW